MNKNINRMIKELENDPAIQAMHRENIEKRQALRERRRALMLARLHGRHHNVIANVVVGPDDERRIKIEAIKRGIWEKYGGDTVKALLGYIPHLVASGFNGRFSQEFDTLFHEAINEICKEKEEARKRREREEEEAKAREEAQREIRRKQMEAEDEARKIRREQIEREEEARKIRQAQFEREEEARKERLARMEVREERSRRILEQEEEEEVYILSNGKKTNDFLEWAQDRIDARKAAAK